MSELNEDLIYQYFKEQIAKEAKKDFSLESEKIEKLIEEKKLSIHDSLRAKYDLKLQLMKTELKHQHDQDIRQLETKFLKQNGLQRVQTIDKLFLAVETKLLAFVSSKAYESFIIESFSVFKDLATNRPVTIMLRQQDNHVQPLLLRQFPQAKFEFTTKIQFGGYYVQFTGESIRYDLTLDAKWQQVKKLYFEEKESHE